MKTKAQMAARILLGLVYFVFGLNGFLNFIKPPADAMPESAIKFVTALMETGYFFPFLKGTEVLCGLLLLLGMFSPLMLIILAPITIQIILFHGIMTPGFANLLMPLLMLVLHVLAATKYWSIYQPLFNRCSGNCSKN